MVRSGRYVQGKARLLTNREGLQEIEVKEGVHRGVVSSKSVFLLVSTNVQKIGVSDK